MNPKSFKLYFLIQVFFIIVFVITAIAAEDYITRILFATVALGSVFFVVKRFLQTKKGSDN